MTWKQANQPNDTSKKTGGHSRLQQRYSRSDLAPFTRDSWREKTQEMTKRKRRVV